jgi:hypothetical protein
MKNHHSDFYFGSWKPVTSVLGVGLLSLTTGLETGVLRLSPEVERQIQAMIHTSHAPVQLAPSTNSALSASGTSTASMTGLSSITY